MNSRQRQALTSFPSQTLSGEEGFFLFEEEGKEQLNEYSTPFPFILVLTTTPKEPARCPLRSQVSIDNNRNHLLEKSLPVLLMVASF